MPWEKPYRPAHNQRLDGALYRDPGHAVFVTIRAYGSASPFVRPALCRMVVGTLAEEAVRQSYSIFVYCLMPNHLHYVVRPFHELASILSFTNRFKGKTTNQSWKLGWEGKLWQPRFYDHIVRAEESLHAISQYILANPVRKGFVDQPEDWPWSGLLDQSWP